MTTLTSQNALLAPLFADPEIDGIFATEAMLDEFTRFEIALTRALADAGQLDCGLAARAIASMETFAPDVAEMADRIVADGVVVPVYVAQLKAHVGDELASAVHVGTTSQDLIDTAFAKLFSRANDLILDRLNTVLSCVSAVIIDHGNNSLMGRTRMQAALPIHVGDRASVWNAQIIQLREELLRQRPSVERISFGGPVGNRSAYGKDADQIGNVVADELSLSESSSIRHSDRLTWIAYGDLMSHIAGALGKVGQDLCLMAQQGIDEVRLSGGGKSSAMPHKQNPIPAELLVTLARFNATQISGLHHALVHEQERSGAMWTLEWMILPEMVRVTGRALVVASDLLRRIEHMGTR